MPIAINGAGTGDLPATTGARKQTPPQLNPIQVCATTDSIERCAPNPYHQNEPSLAQMRSNLADAAAVIFIPGAGEGGYVAKTALRRAASAKRCAIPRALANLLLLPV